MYVVTGATGQVGSSVADYLLKQNKKVRVVVRSAEKGEPWAKRGAQVAIADVTNRDALAKALKDAEVVFVFNPPNYTSPDMLKDTEEVLDAYVDVLKESNVERIVGLSSIGGHLEHGTGMIKVSWILESKLKQLDIPTTFVRPPNFYDNWKPQKEMILKNNSILSFFLPLDEKIPQVSSIDIGQTIAKAMIADPWKGIKIIELYGPEEYSVNDVADAFSKVFNKQIVAVGMPESAWKDFFINQMKMSEKMADSRVEMFKAFNDKHTVFENTPNIEKVRGTVTLLEAVSKF
jgi:uncharacterized protein YbjT (DUF2867 family)